MHQGPADALARQLLLRLQLTSAAAQGHPAGVYYSILRQCHSLVNDAQSGDVAGLLLASESQLRLTCRGGGRAEALHLAQQALATARGPKFSSAAACQVARCELASGLHIPQVSNEGLVMSALESIQVAQALYTVGNSAEADQVLDHVKEADPGAQWVSAANLLQAAVSFHASKEALAAKVALLADSRLVGGPGAAVGHVVLGGLCVELARRGEARLLLAGRRSLLLAIRDGAPPGAHLLLAEAEALLGSKGRGGTSKQEALIEQEWQLWPPGRVRQTPVARDGHALEP